MRVTSAILLCHMQSQPHLPARGKPTETLALVTQRQSLLRTPNALLRGLNISLTQSSGPRSINTKIKSPYPGGPIAPYSPILSPSLSS
ncbi:hypothetical protein N431DRAFT_64520 [Stipitochalara longipes BDJ]|nr:hypothetical protein N431DRAFT_64520 [Stipitochalara longipes BDJ]